MRAYELLKDQVVTEIEYDEEHPFSQRYKEGHGITLRALHELRKQRDLKELELEAHKRFVRRMYASGSRHKGRLSGVRRNA